MGASADDFVVSGALDAGSPAGRLEEVTAEFMEYMCFAYRGGYAGSVVYEVQPDEPDSTPLVFCFHVDKKHVRAAMGEPEKEPSVRIAMTHNTFHRVFFASPSKWELMSLMMRGFIRVSGNDYREVGRFATCFDYSRWKEFYSLYRPEKNNSVQSTREDAASAPVRPAIPRIHAIPVLACGRYLSVGQTPAGAVASAYFSGTPYKGFDTLRDILRNNSEVLQSLARADALHQPDLSTLAVGSGALISRQLEVLDQARVAHGLALMTACREGFSVPSFADTQHSGATDAHRRHHHTHSNTSSHGNALLVSSSAEGTLPTTAANASTGASLVTANTGTSAGKTRTVPRYLDIHMPHTYAATTAPPYQRVPVRRKAPKWAGAGTPPSTGAVHLRTLIGSLPSSIVTPKVVDFAPILERHVKYYYESQQQNSLRHQQPIRQRQNSNHLQQLSTQQAVVENQTDGQKSCRIEISVVASPTTHYYYQYLSAAAMDYFGFSSGTWAGGSDPHRLSPYYGWLMYWPMSMGYAYAPATMSLAPNGSVTAGPGMVSVEPTQSVGSRLWGMVSWALPFWR